MQSLGKMSFRVRWLAAWSVPRFVDQIVSRPQLCLLPP